MKGSLGINISYVFLQILLYYPFFDMILGVIKIHNQLLQRNGAWLPFQKNSIYKETPIYSTHYKLQIQM